MRRKNCWGLGIILGVLFIISASSLVSGLRINEVELNPPGEDRGNEWLELYSENTAELDGFKLINVKGKSIGLNGSFSGYKIIFTSYSFLTNEKQKIKLIDSSGNTVDETDEMSDTVNNDKSWQLCEEWIFADSSREKKNNCPSGGEPEEETEETEKETTEDKKTEEEATKKEEEEETRKLISEAEYKTVEKKAVKEKIVEKQQPEIITLNNPKSIKSPSVTEYKSAGQYIKDYAIYAFALFLCIIIIMLLRRKI
ncbi:MAG: hypothetical protein AABX71_03345 [Nanoarchaeota archaeon]